MLLFLCWGNFGFLNLYQYFEEPDVAPLGLCLFGGFGNPGLHPGLMIAPRWGLQPFNQNTSSIFILKIIYKKRHRLFDPMFEKKRHSPNGALSLAGCVALGNCDVIWIKPQRGDIIHIVNHVNN